MTVHRVGLIGAGIQKSLSPALHEAEGAAQAIDYRYTLFDLDRIGRGGDALPDILSQMVEQGFAGANVTYPVKQTIMPLLDRLDHHAEAIGAVNTVRFATDGAREGYNTDWEGFGANLRRGLGARPLGRVVLLGAGGAGAAAGYALGQMGAFGIVVVDSDNRRAAALADRLAAQGFAAEAAASERIEGLLAKSDGLVHATPTGTAKHPGIPIEAGWLRPDLWVAEIVYVPLETELVRAARAVGALVIDGGGMVVLQAARAFEIFTGQPADRERMFGHFAELVRT